MPFGGPRDPIQRTILGLRNLWLNDETKIAADCYQHDSSNPPQQARQTNFIFWLPQKLKKSPVCHFLEKMFGEKMFRAVNLHLFGSYHQEDFNLTTSSL